MATSVINICNLALTRVGADTITSLEDDTTRAKLCRLHYPESVETTLSAKDWRFARSRATLVPLATSPAFEWVYQFQLPSDCLLVTKVYDAGSLSDEQVDWQAEGDKVMANVPKINIVYNRNIKDVLLFSAGFTRAVTLLLAAELATGIKASRSLRQELLAEYEHMLRRSGAREGRQGRNRRFRPGLLVQGRG